MGNNGWFEMWDICGTSYAPFPLDSSTFMQRAPGTKRPSFMSSAVALTIASHLRRLGAVQTKTATRPPAQSSLPQVS